MKKVLTSMFVFVLSFIFIFTISNTKVSASVPVDLEAKSISFTEDDLFSYMDVNYNLNDYKNSINIDEGLFGCTISNENGMYYITGDDPIVNIIPKEYFYMLGSHTFIGREYGFFIRTINEVYRNDLYELVTSTNYRSYVIVFDITNDTNVIKNVDKAIFTVTNLFSLEFITINPNENTFGRLSDINEAEYPNDADEYHNPTGFLYVGDENYYVVPLFDLKNNAETNRYYLNDISFAGTLQNEQAYNEMDAAYSAKDDKGSFFTGLYYFYDGKYIVEGSWADVDFGEIVDIILSRFVDTLFSKIPVAGDIFSVVKDGFEILEIIDEGLSDKEYDINNESLLSKEYYSHKNEQVDNYGFLTKCAYFALISNSDLAILHEKDDYARIEYKLGHGASEDEEAIYTRMNSEIALKVVDRYCNVISSATSKNQFSLRKPVYEELSFLSYNSLYLLENGTNYFSFTPDYSGKYEINVNSTSILKVSFDDLTNLGTSVSLEKVLNKGTTYYFTIKNMSTNRICQTFNFEVSEDASNISISNNNNYLVKLTNISGFKKISFSNTNAKVKIHSSNFTLLKENDTNLAYYLFTDKPYYVVIENYSSSKITGDLLIQIETSSISFDETTNINVSKGDKFYSFTSNSSVKHSVTVFDNSTSDYTFSVYSNNGIMSPIIYYGSNYIRYDYNFTSGNTYYIGYENASLTNGNISIIIKTGSNIYNFYIDGELVTDGEVYLKQGQFFDVEVKLKDIKLEDPEFISTSSNHLKYIDGKFQVLPTAPISSSNYCKIAFIDPEEKELEFVTLKIIPSFNIILSQYTTYSNIANRIKWEFESTSPYNSADFVLRLTYQDGTIRELPVTAPSGNCYGYVTVPQNGTSSSDVRYGVNTTWATVEVSSVDFSQGWLNPDEGIERYPMSLTNSYPYASVLSNKEFLIPSVNINMMFEGGTGTLSDPYKIINSWQLNNVRYMTRYVVSESDYMVTDNFVVMNSITVSNTQAFEPLPILSGSFKGYNSQLKSITIGKLDTGNQNSGLFGMIWNGTVEHISVRIDGESYRYGYGTVKKGAICGYMIDGIISSCEARGKFDISSNNPLSSKIGGIVGEVSRGTISNCKNYMTISTYGCAGGIVGKSFYATIYSCKNYGNFKLQYNIGSVTKDIDNPAIGGIVGFMYSGTTVSSCHVDCNLSSKELIVYEGSSCKDKALKPCLGPVVGRNVNGTVTNNYIMQGIKINSGSLQIFKEGGFLGIGGTKYNQLEYVATGTNPCGRVG
jgi:hypothetical protein